MTVSIYVVAPAQKGPVKVGFSSDPHKRIHGIQVGNPERLFVFKTWEVPDSDTAEMLERMIHKDMIGACHRHVRLQGEWFAACVHDAESVIEDVVGQWRLHVAEGAAA